MPNAPSDLPDPQVEALLRASRPAADVEFVAALETKLLPARSRSRFLPRPIVAGGLATTGIAIGVLALSLLGMGPLAGGTKQDVNANPACHDVLVKKRIRVPVLVQSAGRTPRIEYRHRLADHGVKRCDSRQSPPH